MLLAVLLSWTAAAADPAGPDLPTMAERFGWGSVASVVQAVSTGDVSVSHAHMRLRELGLDRVVVPVRADPALGDVGPLGPLTGCGWNQGVTCHLDLPAGTPRQLPWTPRCANRKGLVDATSIGPPLTVVTEPDATAEAPGRAHIGDLQTCWLAGGDRVRLVPVGAKPRPRPTLLVAEGVSESQGQVLLDAHGAALAECMTGHGVIVATFADGALASVKVVRDGRTQEAETACTATALADASVDAMGAATIKWVVPTR